MSDFPDWASILPLPAAPLPLAEDPDFRWSTDALVRRGWFRLAELPAALARRETPAVRLWVHVDVLRIEGPLELAAPHLVLHARRIEVAADASLALNTDDEAAAECRIEIHADEWAFEDPDAGLRLNIGGVRHDLHAQPPGGGLDAQIGADGSVDLCETAEIAFGDPLSGQIALDTARRLLHCPQLDSSGGRLWTRELAIKMADWVARTGGHVLLRADAHAFAQRLRAHDDGRHPVPVLRLAEYGSLAKDTRAALADVELAFRDQFHRALDIGDQKRAAENMLSHYRNAKGFADKLLAQAAEDMAKAQTAVAAAQSKLSERRAEVMTCQEAFDAGVKAKEAELKQKAVFDILGAVLEVGASVAAIVATGGAAAPVAGPAVANAAAKTADAASRINKLLELIKKIMKVLQVIGKLAACATQIKGVYDALDRPALARQRAEQASTDLPEPLTSGEKMTATDWEEFAVGLGILLADAVELKIDGAADYLLALQKMGVRGKDLVASHALLDRSVHTLQQRLWQTLRDEADIADMQSRIDAITDERGPGGVLMTYYGQVRDRLSFRLIHAIDQMRDAYRYETLTEPKIRPSITQSSADLAALLSDLQEALVRAKEKRQALGSWTDYLTEDDPAVLDSFRQTGALSWVIDFNSFADYDRVRISEMRVWLRGQLGPARRLIDIASSGSYSDRSGPQTFAFDTRPLERSFSYEPTERGRDEDYWGQPVRVLHRANDSDGDYFQPTAFTTWTMRLAGTSQAAAELAGLQGIAIEFFGTAVRAAPVRLGARRRSAKPTATPRLLRKVVTL